jgi:eukaryotic-like serine/threonine-protein kinase
VSVNDPPEEPPSAVADDLSSGTFGQMIRAVAAVPGREATAVGKRFGRYEIVGELGRGGMGVVYEAIDAQLERRVALKLLPGELVGADRRELFLSEVLVTAGLEHPGIVPVYDAGETPDGNLFYTMRKVSGRTLAALIAEAPAPSDRMALLPHLIACANAVAYAHDLGIIHRDLKPSNVIIGAFGEAVVVDWGIATRVSATAEATGPAYARRLGTPAYMAPEQAAGAELSPRTDVYALGAMLYHLLDGRPPPRTAARFSARDDLAPELIAVIDKAMAADPAARYPSLRELAEELRRFQAGQLVGAHRYSLKTLLWRWIRKHRSKVITACALTVVLATFSFVALRAIVQGRDDAERARQIAERAQASAETRTREMRLLHARSEVPHDPTAAIAWLKRSPHEPSDWTEEQQIAIESWARGVARYVLRGPAAFTVVTVAPGARTVAASLPDRILWWDDLTRPPHELRAADGVGRELKLGGDGRTLISSDGTSATRIWDLTTGTSRRVPIRANYVTFAPHGDGVLLQHRSDPPRFLTLPALTELPLGKDAEAAAIADDGTLIVARPAAIDVVAPDQRVLHTYPREPRHTNEVEASRDGKRIALGTDSGVDVLDRSSGRTSGRWQHFTVAGAAMSFVRFSPDGRWLVSCGSQVDTWLFDLQANTASVLSRNERCFSSMAFLPDGALLTVGYDDNIHVWAAEIWQSRAIRGQQGAISDLQLSSDGAWLAVTGNDATVRVFWFDATQTISVRNAMAISAIATTGAQLIRDRAAGTFSLRGSTGGIELLASVDYAQIPDPSAMGGLSRDGQVACFLDGQGAIVVVDRRTGKRSSFGPFPDGKIAVTELSPSGARLATITDLGVVRAIELATGEARVLGRHEEPAAVARFSPDEAALATGGRGPLLRVWELASGHSTDLVGHTARIWDVAFSPDGSWLASASADGTVRSFQRDGRPRAVYDAHAGPLLSVDISPDGQEILSTSIDGAVRRWSVATGQGVIIRWYPGALWGGRYSADGTRFSASYPGAFIVTDPTVPALRHDQLGTWLDATTTATIDDNGHLSGPAVSPGR